MIHWDINSLFWSIVALVVTAPISVWLTSMSPMRIRVYAIIILQPFAWLRKPRINLNGTWEGIYIKGSNFDEPIDGKIGKHKIRIYQFGQIVVGKSTTHDSKVIVVGELREHNVFSGTYYDPRKENKESRKETEYYGTFQVIFNEVTNEMIGKWIGFNNDTKSDINTGIWKWKEDRSYPM